MSDESPSGSPRVALIGKIAGVAALIGILMVDPPKDMVDPARHVENAAAAWRLLAVTAMMLCFWLTSAVPIAVTSLIPVAAFPLFGILTAAEVSNQFINDKVFLYFGGFVVALGIERWGLHRRIALNIVRVIGTSPRTVVLGFMVASGFLSMWISNTATTLMMLPIALALLHSLRELNESRGGGDEAHEHLARLEIPLLLGIAYAASIGGMTTLVGTPTNVAFLGILKSTYPGAPAISTGQWIASFLPMGIAFILVSWVALTFRVKSGLNLDRQFFRDEVRNLGPMSRGEKLMTLIFFSTAMLWIFRRDLNFGVGPTIPGWERLVVAYMGKYFDLSADVAKSMVNDSTVAMLMCVLMFLIPVDRDRSGNVRNLMDWKTLNRMPWGILLLFGGGFALAEGFTSTHLSDWIGERSSGVLRGQEMWVLVAGICFVMTFLTEVTTNVATVSAMLPVLASMAVSLGIHPLAIMIPATVSTSCAFMLPIATPPNAIVFSSGKLSPKDMAMYGVVLNLIGVVLVTAATFWLVLPQMGIDPMGVPEWVKSAAAGAR